MLLAPSLHPTTKACAKLGFPFASDEEAENAFRRMTSMSNTDDEERGEASEEDFINWWSSSKHYETRRELAQKFMGSIDKVTPGQQASSGTKKTTNSGVMRNPIECCAS